MTYNFTQASQVMAIAEQEYGAAAEVRFTRFTSCVGLLGLNGQNVSAVHLVAVSDTGTTFDQGAANGAVAALGPYTQVIVIGNTDTWATNPVLSGPFNYLLGLLTTATVVPSVMNAPDGVYGGRVDSGTFQIYWDGQYFDAP